MKTHRWFCGAHGVPLLSQQQIEDEQGQLMCFCINVHERVIVSMCVSLLPVRQLVCQQQMRTPMGTRILAEAHSFRGHHRGSKVLMSINTFIGEPASPWQPARMNRNTTLLTLLSIEFHKAAVIPSISAISPWDGERIERDGDKTERQSDKWDKRTNRDRMKATGGEKLN